MPTQSHKRILLAPLDWGMGHTTRCVPLIQYLLQNGHSVVFAGNEHQCSYITKTFPAIETIHLEGYNVQYSHSASGFMFSLLKQIPHLLKTVKEEHNWLLKLATQEHFDGIISDNRYGLFHPTIPSVIITHQLQVLSGMGAMADNLLRLMHYKRLKQFNQCWIADVAGKPNLAGKLAHPKTLPPAAKYIGLLSQIENNTGFTEEHLLVLLSGPEPQRSILSDMLWQQIQDYKGKVVFVEGSEDVPVRNIPAHVSYHKRVTKDVLQPLLERAAMVICRSGYSSLMDLAVLNKKAILIPTPGQTEQEYLGKHLHQDGVQYCAAQKNFNLQQALSATEKFPYRMLLLHNAHQQYKTVLDEWVKNL